MKNITWIVAFLLFLSFVLYNANKTDKKLKAKDERIRELEFQVWSLKLDRRLDSIREYHVGLLNRKMDSAVTRLTQP